MKKTFAQITDGLHRSLQSSNFDRSHETQKKFNVVHLDACKKFLSALDEICQNKIETTLYHAEQSIDSSLFKKLNGTIWEFRIRCRSLQVRLLAFWDKNDGQSLVLTTHGFVKKTSKVPSHEILRAEKIRSHYIDHKLWK